MAEVPQACIVHQIPGRIRIRIPEHRNDRIFFERVGARARELPGVQRVETNASTASVLILGAQIEPVMQRLVAEELFTLVDRAPGDGRVEGLARDTLVERGRQTMHALDRGVTRLTQGRENLQSLVLAGLLGGGIIQLMRGNVLAPGSTLIWYAGGLLGLWYDDPAARTAGTADSGELSAAG